MVQIIQMKNNYYIKCEDGRKHNTTSLEIYKGCFKFDSESIMKAIQTFLLFDIAFSVKKSVIY